MAEPIDQGSFRAPIPAVRWLLVAAAVLAVVAGVEAFVLSERTETFFAWTIASPLTAAFLGACYLGAVPLVLMCSRSRTWGHARLGFPAVLVLLVLLLLVTLRHIDRFHMDAVTGWQWLAVYSLMPPIMVVVLVRQVRVPGADPPRRFPLPAWLRSLLWAQAAVMGIVGTALLVVPGSVTARWPWPLTTLTARAAGAWLVAVAAATAHSCLENDWPRLYAPFVAYVVLAALQFVALARYGDEIRWDDPAAWLYVGFLAGVLTLALYGASRARSTLPTREPADARRGG